MGSTSIFDSLCSGSGSGGRLALGASVLVYVIVYNETSAACCVCAILLATIYGSITAHCKSRLSQLPMPYIRASNKFDFTCLFLATWLDMLATLCACSALARTLSTCLDAMTGGVARILILGRNSPTNEIWPDFMGVAIVFLVTGMFMLGLEHSKAFSVIMSSSLLGLFGILSAVCWWNGDMHEWSQNLFLPNGLSSYLTAVALLTYSYPSEFQQQRTGIQRFLGVILVVLVNAALLLTAICLSTIVHYKAVPEYIAVPLFAILNENSFNKLVPAAACLLMLTCSGAYMEFFPELYGIIVRFATSEWRLLSKQISYESADSGNPVLAIFIGGSLCAMFSFACPLKNLCFTLAASHLSAGLFRAVYLLYSPFRPKYIQHCSSESSLSYSRLATAPITVKSSSSSSRNRHKRSLWNLGLPKQKLTLKKPKAKPINKQEVEKEWLLLGEPQSPCPQREPKDVESSMLSDGDPTPSDFEYPSKFENSDSDTSTDIDAIVDEYRQKIKVTTAGPMEHSVRLPTMASWRVTLFAMFVITSGIALTVAGIALSWAPAALTGSIGVFIISIMMTFIPKYPGNSGNVSPVLCCTSIALGVLLIAACVEYSWICVTLWLMAGLIMLLRCDNWCCNCFNQTLLIDEPLIPSVSARTATTIRLPRPPKGLVTIPTRVNGNR